jgi:hypothetical protein
VYPVVQNARVVRITFHNQPPLKYLANDLCISGAEIFRDIPGQDISDFVLHNVMIGPLMIGGLW